MPRSNLNQSFVNSIESTGSERTYFDKSLPGFAVRISANGTKSYFIQRRLDGREIKRTIGRADYLKFAEAKRRAKRLIGEMADGKNPFAPSVISVSSWEPLFDYYMEDHAKKEKKPRSVSEDQRLIDSHLLPRLRGTSPEKLSRQEIIDLRNNIRSGTYPNSKRKGADGLQNLKGGAVTANRCLALMSKVFNFGRDNGLLSRIDNPVVRVPRFTEHRREAYLSTDEVQSLWKAIADARKFRTERSSVLHAIEVLLLTGARCGEISSLKWSEVDFDRNSIFKEDSKTGAREIQFEERVRAILLRRKKRAKGKPTFVFPGVQSAEFVSLRKPWARLRSSAGLSEKYTLHTLRHTFASQAVMNGISAYHLQKLLGHKSVETTGIYVKIASSASREALHSITSGPLKKSAA